MTLDGYDEPLHLQAELRVAGGHLTVDYAGSSPASGRGINSPKCYTDAYSVFGLKCLIAPEVPNNTGSLAWVTDVHNVMGDETGAPLPHGHLFFAIYVTMTAIHGLHVIIGAGLILWVMKGVAKGRFHAGYYLHIEPGASFAAGTLEPHFNSNFTGFK